MGNHLLSKCGMSTSTDDSYLESRLTALGLTNSAVAEACDTTTEAVRLWRAGRRMPGIASVKKLAMAYGLDKHQLRPDVWDAPAPQPAPPEKIRAPVTGVAAGGGKGRARVSSPTVSRSAAAKI